MCEVMVDIQYATAENRQGKKKKERRKKKPQLQNITACPIGRPQNGYISPLRAEAPVDGCTPNLAQPYRGRRRNHLWQIFGDRLTGVDSVGGRKLSFPIDKARRR